MMMNDTIQHPLDYETLEKGQQIPRTQCEAIFGFTRRGNPDAYAFAVMGLCKNIEEERQDLVAIGRDYGIAVLTDEEAVGFLRSTFTKLCHKVGRLSRRSMRIDMSQLAAEVVKTCEFYQQATAWSAAMLKKELRKVKDQEHLLEMASKVKVLDG